MKSAHKIEPYTPEHDGVLYAAHLSGCDIKPITADRFIGYGETKYGFGPACILDLAGTEYVAEPHVTWFPWTSAANRIVNFKWAMEYLAKERVVFLTVEKKEVPFFDHFVKRGLLRKIGYLEDLPILGEVHMYQYKRSN
jgi:hypothetical protein